MLKLNGITVRQPNSMTVNINDLDDRTTRSANGTLIRDRIAIKRKINLTWAVLTPSQLSTILQAVKNTHFLVTYPDPYVGSTQTKTFYVGDRSSAIYTYKDGSPVWENLAMNLIEV